MPHFSKGKHTFQNFETNKNYRLTGWVNMPTKWNDSNKSYEPRTPQQIDAQQKIYELMKEHDAGIQVVVHERVDGLEPKDFPVKHRITLYVNNYGNNFTSNTNDAPIQNYQAPDAPAAATPPPPITDTGWD